MPNKIPNYDSNLESSVMDQIFHMEKKKTTLIIVEYILLTGIFLVLGVSTTLTLLSMLTQSEYFDLFELFTQDKATITTYLPDTLHTIYIETPKLNFFLSFLFIFSTIVVLYLFGKRLPTIWHKLQSIRKFSGSHHKH